MLAQTFCARLKYLGVRNTAQNENMKQMIKQLITPRELNIFLQDLIVLLNAESSINSFIPTKNNIEIALEKTKFRMN